MGTNANANAKTTNAVGRRKGTGTLADQIAALTEGMSVKEVAAAAAIVKGNSAAVVKLAFKSLPKTTSPTGLGKRVDDILDKIADVKQREAMRVALLTAKAS